MKALLYHFMPFSLAHGGQQIQIERTHEALRAHGIDAEYLDWHRPEQVGDILHFFGRIPLDVASFAKAKGMQVVVSDLLAGQGARGQLRLLAERSVRRGIERALPAASWKSYRRADACVALTRWEARLLQEQFGVEADRIHVIPNGVDEVFFESPAVERGAHLLCVATIAPVKRVLELAQAAVLARVPVRFFGKPYSQGAYAEQFLRIVKAHPDLLSHEGHVASRAELASAYRLARGFVLVSAWESLSLAALEAAASKCPLLLSDLPWARTAFGDRAAYCPAGAKAEVIASHLRAFADNADRMPIPERPLTWGEVGGKIASLYRSLVPEASATGSLPKREREGSSVPR